MELFFPSLAGTGMGLFSFSLAGTGMGLSLGGTGMQLFPPPFARRSSLAGTGMELLHPLAGAGMGPIPGFLGAVGLASCALVT